MFLSFLCLLLKMRLDLTNESKYKKKKLKYQKFN